MHGGRTDLDIDGFAPHGHDRSTASETRQDDPKPAPFPPPSLTPTTAPAAVRGGPARVLEDHLVLTSTGLRTEALLGVARGPFHLGF